MNRRTVPQIVKLLAAALLGLLFTGRLALAQATVTDMPVMTLHAPNCNLSLRFSPDSSFLLTVRDHFDDKRVCIFSIPDGQLVREFGQAKGKITGAAFSPDARLVVYGSEDHKVRVADASTGSLVTEMDAHGPVRSVAWSADGRFIVAGGDDKRMIVWDGASFAQRFEAPPHREKITCVAVSPDGRFAASASEDKRVRVVDLQTGSQAASLEARDSKLSSVAFSGDGRFICTGEEMEHYCVWRVPGFAMLGEFPHENANDILSVALSSDGRLGASGGRDAKVVIWDIEGRRALGRREAHNDVLSLAFSPNGKYLAAGTNDKGVLVFGVSGIGSAPALAAAVPVAPPPLVPSVATMLAPRRPAPQTDMFPTDASGQRLGLAVLDFDLRGRLKQSEPDAGRTISSLVLSRIDPNRFEIYERSQIMQLLQEQKLQMSDIMTDTDKAIKFGKLKGIRFIVLGSVDQLGETYFITARIVDCETGRVGVKADATTNILDHLGPSVDQLLGNMGLVGQ